MALLSLPILRQLLSLRNLGKLVVVAPSRRAVILQIRPQQV